MSTSSIAFRYLQHNSYKLFSKVSKPQKCYKGWWSWVRFNVPPNTLQVILGMGFYRWNDPTNSVKALKEDSVLRIMLQCHQVHPTALQCYNKGHKLVTCSFWKTKKWASMSHCVTLSLQHSHICKYMSLTFDLHKLFSNSHLWGEYLSQVSLKSLHWLSK